MTEETASDGQELGFDPVWLVLRRPTPDPILSSRAHLEISPVECRSVSNDIDADVTIVGYGPVGNTLAILLAQLGRTVIVLERETSPYPKPRAAHFDDEVGRIFQSCGIGAELRSIIEPADSFEVRNGAGRTLLRFDHTGNGPSGWPASSMFHQPTLEALLRRRADRLPTVDVRTGVEVIGLVEETLTSVTAATADGGTVRSRYLVGCDGANSTVRALADLPLHDLGYFFDWLVVDVVPDPPRVFDRTNLQICDPNRPTTAVSGGPGRRRWEFMRLPDEPIEDLDDELKSWELLAPWDVRPENATLERHAIYTFNARYAERWRNGRVMLAGDAAHLMPPFAGQGMCAGIRDAANLAWKLDFVIRGVSPVALLDTYEQERRPHVEQIIEFSMELGAVICVTDVEQAAVRDEAMAAATDALPAEVPRPNLDAGIVHLTSPYAGEIFLQGSDHGVPLDELHGSGWRMITLDNGQRLDEPDQAWFEALGGRIVALHDPDPLLSCWFDERDAAFVLERPDFHIYGTAASGSDASVLLGDLRRHLGGGVLDEAFA
jgi:2-polyprenyl-6-methoxyphenol hydroxylase-like FAD-dependent oxidoreductase